MNQSELVKAGMALGILFGVYKLVKNDHVRAMALGVAGVVIATKVPVLKDVV